MVQAHEAMKSRPMGLATKRTPADFQGGISPRSAASLRLHHMAELSVDRALHEAAGCLKRRPARATVRLAGLPRHEKDHQTRNATSARTEASGTGQDRRRLRGPKSAGEVGESHCCYNSSVAINDDELPSGGDLLTLPLS